MNSHDEKAQLDSMEVFKTKIAKLKMMRDADLLTEEGFQREKEQLLQML